MGSSHIKFSGLVGRLLGETDHTETGMPSYARAYHVSHLQLLSKMVQNDPRARLLDDYFEKVTIWRPGCLRKLVFTTSSIFSCCPGRFEEIRICRFSMVSDSTYCANIPHAKLLDDYFKKMATRRHGCPRKHVFTVSYLQLLSNTV